MQPVQTVIQLAQHLSTVILAVCASAVTVTKWFTSVSNPLHYIQSKKRHSLGCLSCLSTLSTPADSGFHKKEVKSFLFHFLDAVLEEYFTELGL